MSAPPRPSSTSSSSSSSSRTPSQPGDGDGAGPPEPKRLKQTRLAPPTKVAFAPASAALQKHRQQQPPGSPAIKTAADALREQAAQHEHEHEEEEDGPPVAAALFPYSAAVEEEEEAEQGEEQEAAVAEVEVRPPQPQEQEPPRPPPAQELSLTHTFHVKCVGMKHHLDTGAFAAVAAQPAGVGIFLERDPANAFDPNAVRVSVTVGGEVKMLGFLPRAQAATLAPFLDPTEEEPGGSIRILHVGLPQQQGHQQGYQQQHRTTSPAATAVAAAALHSPRPHSHPQGHQHHQHQQHQHSPSPRGGSSRGSLGAGGDSPVPPMLVLEVAAEAADEQVLHALQHSLPSPPHLAAAERAKDEARAARDRAHQAAALRTLEAAVAEVGRRGTRGLRVLSLFDGIGAAALALRAAGVPVALYCSSEVDAHANAVLHARFGAFAADDAGDGSDAAAAGAAAGACEGKAVEVEEEEEEGEAPLFVHLGDVKLVTPEMVALLRSDLVIGGSPCQDLSRMNASGKGLEGPRSRLFFEYLRLRDLALGLATSIPTPTASSSSSSASAASAAGAMQTTTGAPTRAHDAHMAARPVAFILENVVPRQAEWIARMSKLLGATPLRLDAAEVSAVARDRLYWTNLPFGRLQPPTETPSLADALVSGVPAVDLPNNLTAGGTKASCIVRSVHRDWNLIEDPDHPAAQVFGSRYRRLLPVEEERLMGFPDGWTEVYVEDGDGCRRLTDHERHALLGNSFSVPVVAQLVRRLRPVAEVGAEDEAGRAAALDGLGLLPIGSPAAMRWCSNCCSRVCMCI